MSRRFRHILRTVVAIFMAIAVLLPLGGRMCSHCTAAAIGLLSTAEQHVGCPNCQRASSECTEGATRSCCAKQTANHHGAPSLCACGDTSPADRPAASPQIDLNSAQLFAIVAPSFVWPERNRLEAAPEVAEFAPDVPLRILHCSWLN